MERFSNNAITSLSSAITNTTTSLSVASAVNFPTNGNFRILVESEYMLVTAVSGTTFTVTRGIEGSTAAAHGSGVPVNGILTAGAIEAFRADNQNGGAYSSLPTAEAAGRLYFPNNAPTLQRDNGTSWDKFGPLYQFTTPGDVFSWVNQNSASKYVLPDGTLSWTPSVVSGNNATLLVKSGVGSGYIITAYLDILCHCAGFPAAGLCLYDSVSGKFTGFAYQGLSSSPQAVKIEVHEWNSVTSWNDTPYSIWWGEFPKWMRIYDAASLRDYQISSDGYTWMTLYQTTSTQWITPNMRGMFANNGNDTGNSQPMMITLRHWLEQ